MRPNADVKRIARASAEGRGAFSTLLLGGFLAVTLAALNGCAKAKFEKQEFSATANAAVYTKPKIDIIVFQDHSSSMIAPMTTVKAQLNSFIKDFGDNWDYHFVVFPLQGFYPLGSKYILANDCSSVNHPYCLNSSQKNTFNNASGDAGWINSFNPGIGSEDLAFKNMTDNLNQSALITSGFVRPDAILAFIVITNGEDITAFNGSSYLSAASYSNFYIDPDMDGTPEINRSQTQFAAAYPVFKNFIENFSGASKTKRLFAVASKFGDCGFQGKRYLDLAYEIGGIGSGGGYQFDFCDNNALAGVLSGIGFELNALIEAFVFNYAVLGEAPIESSIRVYKNGVEVPKGGPNGWAYEDFKRDFPTAFFPKSANNRTGYFIKLNGTATYKGTDKIRIDYQKL